MWLGDYINFEKEKTEGDRDYIILIFKLGVKLNKLAN